MTYELRNLVAHRHPDSTVVVSIPLTDGRMVRVVAEPKYQGTSATAELFKFLIWNGRLDDKVHIQRFHTNRLKDDPFFYKGICLLHGKKLCIRCMP